MRKLTAVIMTATLPFLPITLLAAPAHAGSFTGKASYYSGYRTASGQRMRSGAMTAAHRSLPFGTRVKVTNLANGRSVDLIINDRGPFVRGRVIDVSLRAADVLAFRHAGVARVRVETMGGARVAHRHGGHYGHHRDTRYAER